MSITIKNGLLVLEPTDFTTSAGDNNNLATSTSIYRVTPANNNDAITGVGQQEDGTLLFISNVHTSNALVVKNNSNASDAANRMFVTSGSDATVPPKQVMAFKYRASVGWVEFAFHSSMIIFANATLNFPSTPAQTSSDLTITAAGAAVGDIVTVGVPNGSVVSNTCYTAWVSATDTVTVRLNNYDVLTAADPASGVFKVSILKY